MGTPTATVRASKPTVGGDSGLWPGELNAGFDAFDAALNQSVTVNIPDTNISLVADGSASDQARYAVYTFTGALTANRTVTLPSNAKIGWAVDSTTGGHSVILSTGGGTTAILGKTGRNAFNCDGTNVAITPANFGALNAATFATTGAFANAPVSGWQMIPAGTSAVSGTVSYSLSANSSIVSGAFYANSDVRLKSGIEDVTAQDALAWLATARPVSYRKRATYQDAEDSGHYEAGFIAQDQVRAGYGRYVGIVPHEGMPELIDDDGLRSLADTSLTLSPAYQIAFLTRALQNALERIAALESGIVRGPP